MTQKGKWQQQKLKIRTSPFNLFFFIKNRIDKLESRLKYDSFWLSWQTWWIILWSLGQSIFYFVWLYSSWSEINTELPIWYIFHNLYTLVANKTALLIPVSINVVIPLISLVALKNIWGKFKKIGSLLVVLQISLTILTIVTLLKITTIYG